MYLVRPAANNRIRPCGGSGKIPGWYTRKPTWARRAYSPDGEAADLSTFKRKPDPLFFIVLR